jgi:NADH dehydrogenase FAD-containing subunit
MSLTFEALFFDRHKRDLFQKFLVNDEEDLLRFKLLTAIVEFKHRQTDKERFERLTDILPLISQLFNVSAKNMCSAEACPSNIFDSMAHLIESNLKANAFTKFVEQVGINKVLRELENVDLDSSDSSFSLHSVRQEMDQVEDIAAKLKEQIGKGILRDVLTGKDIVSWLCQYLGVERPSALDFARLVQQKKRIFETLKKCDNLKIMDDDKTTYKLNSRNKHVLIVGGGFAGVCAALKLEEHFQVTLVDMKREFECIPSFPLLFGNPSHLEKIRYKYEDCLKNTRFKHDEVISISSEFVTLRGGGKIIFDYLIIATGARRAVRFELRNFSNLIQPYESRSVVENHDLLKNAKDIVIIGGGAMAVETAGEVCTHFPNAKVKLISRSLLLGSFNQGVSKSANERLKVLKNLEVILWHRVTLVDTNRVTFCDDFGTCRFVPADVVINCTGMVPNTDPLEAYMPYALDMVKSVIVNSHFQVLSDRPNEHFDNIFAIGDVTNIVEVKLANLAMHHGTRVAKVIHATEAGNKLPRYKTVIEPLTISFGNGSAMLILNGRAVMCNKFIMQLKQRLESKVRVVLTGSKKRLWF